MGRTEEIAPEPMGPTLSHGLLVCPTKVTSHKVGPWLHGVWSRRLLVAFRGGVSWDGGVVDMRKIRVLRLWGVVWLNVSRGDLGGHVPKREWFSHIMWGDWCCPAERGTKAYGSKYRTSYLVFLIHVERPRKECKHLFHQEGPQPERTRVLGQHTLGDLYYGF